MTKRKHFPKGEDYEDEDFRDDASDSDHSLHDPRCVLRLSTRKADADRGGKYTKKFR
jgi:hypothetical protein